MTEKVAGDDEDQDEKINFSELIKLFTGAGSVRELVTRRENEESTLGRRYVEFCDQNKNKY